MIHNPHLEALIAEERYRAILAELTPKQLAVIARNSPGSMPDFDAHIVRNDKLAFQSNAHG